MTWLERRLAKKSRAEEQHRIERTRPKLLAARAECQSVLDRLLRRCVINRKTGCWNWQGAIGAGYGRIKLDGRLVSTHRFVAYAAGVVTALNGSAREECALHECDNRRCCNPQHLRPGSMADNMRDASAKGRLGSRRTTSVAGARPANCIANRPQNQPYVPGGTYAGERDAS